jgi:hypothetical protein
MTAQPISVECDPLRDLRHREAQAARDLADWLAWLELGNKASRTLDASGCQCGVKTESHRVLA